jgi:N-methylhydantoinase B
MKFDDIDPIDLEVLRSRLETVGDQACRAVEQTAISPTVTESKDYSITLLDAKGGLIVGAGTVIYHYGAAVHTVRSTLVRYGDRIEPGDVFLANDPHNGGGLHPQDVMVHAPIFHGNELIAWVGVSAHLIDMGGMTVGSFAPSATECYQEAFRMPSVRLFRRGEEVTDVWDLLRTNVRMAELVEMDLRGLVAGAHFASTRILEVVQQTGLDMFLKGLAAIRDRTEAEFRRRIEKIADGVYRATSWTEAGREFFQIPCALTVAGDTLTFDFEGASPQTRHFFNSKPYIVAAELLVMVANVLAQDLPFNDGIFAPVTIRCPEGSVLNCKPPAPIAAAHMHASLNAAGVGLEALMLALAASPESAQHGYLEGAAWDSALGMQLWAWTTPTGEQDAYIVFDSLWAGSSAGRLRDGNDLGRNTVGPIIEGQYPDIEVLESWYPLLFLERRTRGGADGAGMRRAGSGNQFSFRAHGVDTLHGVTFGMRRWLPRQGLAGGRPGACNEFIIHRADGSTKMIDVSTSGEVVKAADWYEIRLANGGGFGDPLDRDPALVEQEIREGRIDTALARSTYGVIPGDEAATTGLRNRMRRDRLAKAQPAAKPLSRKGVQITGPALPLYPGVVQYGKVAAAEASGAPLAAAPDHWTEGCPVLTERRWPEDGPDVVYRSYLDPETGRVLHVEVALGDAPRTFMVAPRRWTQAGQQNVAA